MPLRDAAQSELISTDSALAAVAAGWGEVVGVDTEFVRERTFFPIPALYQIAGDAGVSLVDACAEQGFDALKTMFAAPRPIKAMHACSEDLEVVDRHLGVTPAGIVDTQLAHAFLAPELSISYAGLVQAHLGLVLAKHETRSNWLQRPLSAKQLAYAREDATHLAPIWSRLAERLAETGRMGWFTEEMATLLTRPATDPLDYYRGIRGADRLSRRQLAVLRRLAAWREVEARRRDVPRNRVVADAQLLALAKADGAAKDWVSRVLPKGAVRRYAGDIDALRERALAEDDPPAPLPGPLSPRQGATLKALVEIATERAHGLGMAAALLARKRVLREFVRQEGAPLARLGWRAEALGESLPAMWRRLGQ